jgi:hypothetical protein
VTAAELWPSRSRIVLSGSFAFKGDGVGVAEGVGVDAVVDSCSPSEAEKVGNVGLINLAAVEGAEGRRGSFANAG